MSQNRSSFHGSARRCFFFCIIVTSVSLLLLVTVDKVTISHDFKASAYFTPFITGNSDAKGSKNSSEGTIKRSAPNQERVFDAQFATVVGIPSSDDYQKNQLARISWRLEWLNNMNASKEYVNRIRDVQMERMQRVQQTCGISPRYSKEFPGLSACHVFNNVAFMLIPKAGSTNILRKICIIIGPGCIDRIGGIDEHSFMLSEQRFHRTMGAPELLKYTADSGSREQRPLFIYTVVRNPWPRLVSTYLDKFVYSTKRSYIKLCSVKENWAEFDKQRQANTTYNIWTFREFIEKCVLGEYDRPGWGMRRMNEHWRPIHAEGAFCKVKYNFIGKLETFTDDQKAIFHQYGVQDVDKLAKDAYKYRKPFEKTKQTVDSYSSYWDSLDDHIISRLKDLYYVDCVMFDYPLSPV